MDRTVTLDNVELSDIHNRPELITSLLYKKLLQQIDKAIAGLSQKEYAVVNRAIQLSTDVLERLGFGIKYEAGILADRLEMLYQYVFDLLVQANMKKDQSLLKQAREIIAELDDAWSIAMDKEKNAAGSSVPVTHSRTAAPRLNPYARQEIEHEAIEKAQEKNRNL